MADGGFGIAAVVSIGSKFVERSKFTARHDASCDKEADKTLKMAERFDRIPQEDVDHFELHEFNMLHSKSMEDLRHYRYLQEEYKRRKWVKEPLKKFRTRGKVRHAKRGLQASTAREERHLHDLETISRANSSSGSLINSCANSDTGLDLGGLSRPYRTDSCSIRALGGSPPSASLEDICSEEKKAQVEADVSSWLSSSLVEIDMNSTEALNNASFVMPPNILEESSYQNAEYRSSSKFPEVEERMCPSLHMLTDRGTSITGAHQDSPTSTSLHHHHHQQHFQNSSSASRLSSQPTNPLSTPAISHPYPVSQPSLLLSQPLRCRRPNCNKCYKQANGLKYHMTHGGRNFARSKDLEREVERRLRPYACGVGECQRRYMNMNGLRYHYRHSGDHGALGLALLASGRHGCLSVGRRSAAASSSSESVSAAAYSSSESMSDAASSSSESVSAATYSSSESMSNAASSSSESIGVTIEQKW